MGRKQLKILLKQAVKNSLEITGCRQATSKTRPNTRCNAAGGTRSSWKPLFIAVLTNHARYKYMIFNDIRIVYLHLLRVNRGIQLPMQTAVRRHRRHPVPMRQIMLQHWIRRRPAVPLIELQHRRILKREQSPDRTSSDPSACDGSTDPPPRSAQNVRASRPTAPAHSAACVSYASLSMSLPCGHFIFPWPHGSTTRTAPKSTPKSAKAITLQVPNPPLWRGLFIHGELLVDTPRAWRLMKVYSRL